MNSRSAISKSIAALAAIGLLALTAAAQNADPRPPASEPPPKLGLLQKLNPLGSGGGMDGNHLKLAGSFTSDKATRRGTLTISAQLDPTWHIYSLSQPPGGPEK